MRTWLWIAVGALAVSLPGCSPPATQESPQASARQWVEAVRSDDPQVRRSVIHSATLNCMSEQYRTYFAQLFQWQRRAVETGDFAVTVTPAGQIAAGSSAVAHSDYPIAPEYNARVDFSGEGRTSSLDAFFASNEGGLREVLPCPEPGVAVRMSERKLADSLHASDVAARLDGMPAGLRSSVSALLREGKKVDAIRLYALETETDIMTARDVVEGLRN